MSKANVLIAVEHEGEKLQTLRKYIEYLVDLADEIENSGLAEKYHESAFQLAATPLQSWVEFPEYSSVEDISRRYGGYIVIDDEGVKLKSPLKDLFPKIAKELESLGYHYSKEKRRFLPLVKETGDETLK